MKILNIIKYDLLKMTREKTALIITFLMPVMLILIFGNLNFGDGSNAPKLPVGITNYDNNKGAIELINEIKKDNTILITDVNEKDLYSQVKNSEVIVGFIIPSDFSLQMEKGNIPEIRVVKLPSSNDSGVVEGKISSSYAKLNAENNLKLYFTDKLRDSKIGNKASIISEASTRVDEYLMKPPVVSVVSKIFNQKKETPKADQRTTYTLSFSIVFVMWAVIFAAGEILNEKKVNTWGRLNVSPTGKATIMMGKILGTFVRGWVQVVFLIIFSNLIMGVNWGNSIIITLVVVSIFLLCVTSFGMLMATMVKTFAQLGAVSSIIITCTSMLAGCYWPIEIMPENMQKLAKIFPQYWAMKGLTGNVENLGIGSMITPILVLSGMGLLFFMITIAISRVRIVSKNSKHLVLKN